MSGLVARVLLILRLFQSLRFPLDFLSEFPLFGFAVCFLLFIIDDEHLVPLIFFFLINISSLITYKKKKPFVFGLSSEFY